MSWNQLLDLFSSFVFSRNTHVQDLFTSNSLMRLYAYTAISRSASSSSQSMEMILLSGYRVAY